ncbi:MAG: aromatic amino acid aminotransferase [Deltaproteobacteria bacterium]|nr:MAG: aromatic amino acid aminotransferase [Deltaproteobacteria bacterium]
MWKNIDAAPADAIFGLTEAFKNDPNPQKVNLGAGVYKDNNGLTPVLKSVKAAEQLLLEQEDSKSYLPISGSPVYAAGVQGLLFGSGHEVIKSARAATIHTPGGTGALRVGADLIRRFNPQARIWLSSPTWANHQGIFTAAGFALDHYPYYNAETMGLEFYKMLAALEKIPAGEVVLLHACCHNPSGVDLDDQQWLAVIDTAKKQGWLPFLDFAYQGFARSVEQDAFAVQKFAEAGIDFLIASSFSKNLGLYNERTGALTVVSPSRIEAETALSHMKGTVRVNYSNPPAHGGLITASILTSGELKSQWLAELDEMRSRIVEMRLALVDGLKERGVDRDFSYIKQQRGMFSFSGLSDEIVQWLRDKRSIYVVKGGRINLAGLTSSNAGYVCDAIAEALQVCH